MSPLSLRASLVAWFVGLTMLLLGAFAATLYTSLDRALHLGLDAQLETRAAGMFALCEYDEDRGVVQFGPSHELPDTRGVCDPGEGLEVWTWPDRQLLKRDGDPIEPPLPEDSWDPKVRPAAQFTTLDGPQPHRLCTRLASAPGTPAHDDDAAAPPFEVLVRASASLAPIDGQLARMRWVIAGLFGLSVIAAFGLGALFSRRLVRPLQQLGGAAAAVRGGRPARMPRRGSGDEIDQLADVLDVTFASLDETLARQTRFTANAAHELRNPIAVIRSAAEVALRHERSGDEYRAFLTDVLATSARLGNMVEALLTLARMDAGALQGTFEAVDFLAIAHESAAALTDRAGRFIFADAGDGAGFVHGDERLLRVLADNLLANALRYSNGQPVEVEIGKDSGGRISFRVRDFGPGVPLDAKGRVFERFYRVESGRPDSGGAGLGLAIVAEVARVHSAECELEDAAPGARVTVRFPAASA